jgi:hypothetical protein
LLQIKEAMEQAKIQREQALAPPVRREFEDLNRAWPQQAELLYSAEPGEGPLKRG